LPPDFLGIGATRGSTCSSEALKASHVLEAIGVDRLWVQSSVVFSLGIDNIPEDVESFLRELPPIVEKLRNQLHLENPQERQTQQPLSGSNVPPQSGQAFIPPSMLRFFSLGDRPLHSSRYFSSALESASEQESTIPPSSQAGEGHRIPRSWRRMDSVSIPERKARETMRPVVSFWEAAHPPDFPI